MQPGDAGAEAAEHVDADRDHALAARRRSAPPRVDADRLDEQAQRGARVTSVQYVTSDRGDHDSANGRPSRKPLPRKKYGA